jgi:hypothetical protein
MDVSETSLCHFGHFVAIQTHPRQNKLICRKVDSFAAMLMYPPQSQLIRRNVDFSGAIQVYSRRIKLLQAKTKSSAAKQGSLRQFNFIRGKTNLSAAKPTRLPQSRLLCRKVTGHCDKWVDRRMQAFGSWQGDVSAGWSVEGPPQGISPRHPTSWSPRVH